MTEMRWVWSSDIIHIIEMLSCSPPGDSAVHVLVQQQCSWHSSSEAAGGGSENLHQGSADRACHGQTVYLATKTSYNYAGWHYHTNVGDVHYNCQGHAAVDRQVGNTAWLATNSSPHAHNIPTTCPQHTHIYVCMCTLLCRCHGCVCGRAAA